MTEGPSVVVTGIGIVSPIGIGRRAFWTALCEGRSGIAPLDGARGQPSIAAKVRGFDAKGLVGAAHLRRMDELSRWIVAAGRMALDDAGLALDLPMERVGIVVGSAAGNVAESIAYQERLFAKGPSLASPMLFPNLVLNAPAGYLAMELGVTGVNFTVAQGETSGENAIALGADAIRSGRADVVLAGGGDQLAPIMVETYRACKSLSGQRGGDEWCSPYDEDRNGIVLGEGAAILLLESRDRARARAAEVYAEIAGDVAFSVPSSLYDWPRRIETIPAALRGLLEDRSADAVFGCANSSRLLDAAEVELVARLGAATLTSIKAAIGEFGAAGALTTAAACLAVRERAIPPLCHLRRPIGGTALRFAGVRAQAAEIDRALVLGLARGGGGAGLLLRRAG
jgi:3-oxoacyl-[acyl-carrier-protein] synthase II